MKLSKRLVRVLGATAAATALGASVGVPAFAAAPEYASVVPSARYAVNLWTGPCVDGTGTGTHIVAQPGTNLVQNINSYKVNAENAFQRQLNYTWESRPKNACVTINNSSIWSRTNIDNY
jgi:hypothetical protein